MIPITRQDFEQINFNVFCCTVGRTELVYQHPLTVRITDDGTYADQFGHPVLLINNKLHKVTDWQDAIRKINQLQMKGVI